MRAALVPAALAATAEQWRTRSIYQVVTDRFALDGPDTCSEGSCPYGNYCGGSFKALTQKLDYIQGMGFDAIWISPVVQNADCGYHGYWANDFNKVNAHFGSAADLQALSKALHARGMYLMVDVVFNHAGGDPSKVQPFNSSDAFHPSCAIDFSSQDSIEQCWLANLPDLKQEAPNVQALLLAFAQQLVKDFSVDGLRLDTVPYVPKDFWQTLQQQIGVYTVGEVLIGNKPTSYVAGYQKDPQQGPVLDAVLHYPLFWALVNGFRSKQSLHGLSGAIQDIRSSFQGDQTVLGTFVDNHDNDSRFLSHQADQALLRNALAFIFGWEGVPIVYYGTEQGVACGGSDDKNRCPLWKNGGYNQGDLYNWIRKVVPLRKALTGSAQELWVGDTIYAFSRGDALVATFNVGTGGSASAQVGNAPWSSGTRVCELLTGACTTASGPFPVSTSDGEPQIWRPQQQQQLEIV